MRVAIPTDSGYISSHFARCFSFTVVEIENGKVISTEEIANPGHHPGFLPEFLSGKEIDYIVCGGMGYRAQGLFSEKGIETVIGVSGKVEEIIEKFIKGELTPGENPCQRERDRFQEEK